SPVFIYLTSSPLALLLNLKKEFVRTYLLLVRHCSVLKDLIYAPLSRAFSKVRSAIVSLTADTCQYFFQNIFKIFSRNFDSVGVCINNITKRNRACQGLLPKKSSFLHL
ncbi:MAG: hypothetical protein IJP33_01650, partial [Firmicutes bacterium]|nr:hypothetical protein [Bacillota bacterium]